MPGSLHLGRAFGIDVRVHWTFLVLMLLLLNVGATAVLLVLVFGSVFLHELGHSLVAKSYGIRVLDITFWPLGGMARMSEMPEVPRVEGWIAIAGPLVNFALAAAGGLLLLLVGTDYPAGGTPLGIAADLRAGLGPAGVLSWLVEINLILGLFNLCPAFPMDGGRILRALLAVRRPWLRATEAAVGIGRQLAAAVILFSAISCPIQMLHRQPFPWTLPLIAGFVWFSGGRELWAVRMRELQRRRGREQSIFDLFTSPRPGADPGPPAWDRGQEPREVEFEEELPRRRPRSGFSDEEIQRLERYRGRLPRRRRDEG